MTDFSIFLGELTRSKTMTLSVEFLVSMLVTCLVDYLVQYLVDTTTKEIAHLHTLQHDAKKKEGQVNQQSNIIKQETLTSYRKLKNF